MSAAVGEGRELGRELTEAFATWAERPDAELWTELGRTVWGLASRGGVSDGPALARSWQRLREGGDRSVDEQRPLAEKLARLAADDAQLRGALTEWLERAESTAADSGPALEAPPGREGSNTVGGQARVYGPTLQAGRIEGGVHLYPAAGPSTLVPDQLPPSGGAFVDRQEDRATLDGLRAEADPQGVALLVVSGLAGVGKTALATRWLRAHAADYTDGLLYVDMHGYVGTVAPREPTSVLDSLLRASGVPETPSDETELLMLWRSFTARRRLAVLADNALSAAQVRPLAPAGAGSLLLVTSRNTLSGLLVDGARLHRLAPLDESASLDLLAADAGARVTVEREAALEVVRRCARLPLALRLASAQLALRPRHPVAALATALAAGGGPLSALRLAGESTLYAALEESWRGLPAQVAVGYRRMGMLPLSVYDRRMLDAVLGSREAERTVEVLLEGNLLEEVDDERYRFHDLVHAHARETAVTGTGALTPDESAAEHHGGNVELARTVGRYVDWCLATATAAEAVLAPSHHRMQRTFRHPPAPPVRFDDESAALRWLDLHRAELQAAVRYAATAGWHGACWQLVDALWPLFLRFRPTEWWVEAHELGLAAARRDGSRQGTSRMLTSGGAGLRNAQRHREAGAWFRTALEEAQEDGDRRQESQALNGLGNAHLALDELQAARRHFGQALTLRESIGYRRGAALSRVCLGKTALRADDPAQAIPLLRRAHRDLLAENDRYDAARAQAFLGRAYQELGDRPAGDEQLHAASEAFARAGAVQWHARTWELLASGARRNGAPDEARRHYDRAIALYEPLSPADVERVERLRDQT